MATLTRQSVRIPWFSWLALALMLGFGGVVFALTNGPIVTAWLRWVVTIAWVLYTVILGIYDFLMGGGSMRAARLEKAARGEIDTVAFDRWTISHGGAGLVFGIWYMPLLWVAILVVVWEFFEFFVPGFGEKEIILNRLVDIGIALVLWLVVVLIVMAATGAAFPLAAPVGR